MTALHPLYSHQKVKLENHKCLKTHIFYQPDPESAPLRIYFTSGFDVMINGQVMDESHISLLEEFMKTYTSMYGNKHCSRREIIKVIGILLYVYFKAATYHRIYWKIYDVKNRFK